LNFKKASAQSSDSVLLVISHCSFTSIFAPLLAAAKLLQYPTM
jgi:hypothetical protein